MEYSILIAGYGNIGKHIFKEFERLQPDIYDPNIFFYQQTLEKGKKYDFAFVCVPTNRCKDGSCDTSIVKEVVREINAEVIIIKSTIPPGTTEQLIKKTGKTIIFSPENYGTTQHCPNDPEFVILGGERMACSKVADLYAQVKNGYFKFHFADTKTAELSKYMLNCFLALKVTFCCEFADIAKKFEISYPELRELFIADERVGASHTFVYPEKPYYDSHCFNKDIPAFISFAGEGVPLMSAVKEINKTKKR